MLYFSNLDVSRSLYFSVRGGPIRGKNLSPQPIVKLPVAYDMTEMSEETRNSSLVFKGSRKEALHNFMDQVDHERVQGVYHHDCVIDVCPSRGCRYIRKDCKNMFIAWRRGGDLFLVVSPINIFFFHFYFSYSWCFFSVLLR